MVDRAEAGPDIQWMLARLAAGPRFGWWAVVERAIGVPAGTVLLKPLADGAAEIEIGWHLHPESWGRGTPGRAAIHRTPLASVPCLISDANSTQSRPRQSSRAWFGSTEASGSTWRGRMASRTAASRSRIRSTRASRSRAERRALRRSRSSA
ncbi:MAG: GNAT family N-acetyltransferase [Solirubrobacteraceae bacterium]